MPSAALRLSGKSGAMCSAARFAGLILLLLAFPRVSLAQGSQGGAVVSEDGRVHGLGAIVQDPRTIPGWRERKRDPGPGSSAPLPCSVINTQYLPPVGDQGSQGSCVAWATAYYLRTYMEAKKTGWDPSVTSHQFSPAYMFNQCYFSSGGGMFVSDASTLLEELGCATLDQMPYTEDNCTTWPSEDAYRQAMNYRIDESGLIGARGSDGIAAIKEHLASGNIGFGIIQVFPNFDQITSYGYNYCVADLQAGWTSRGTHATTIIGYDDERVTRDGVGAFRCVNSWGTGWGESGFYWLSYQTASQEDSPLFWSAFTYFTGPEEEPALAARIKVQSACFRCAWYQIGTNTPEAPLSRISLWAFQALGGIGGPTGYAWVDVTRLRPKAGDNVYFGSHNIADWTKRGEILAFDLVDLCSGQVLSSTDTPVAILPTIPWSYANLTYQTTGSIEVLAQPAAQTVLSGHSVQLRVLASGPNPLTYQWYAGESGNAQAPIPGAVSESYTTPPLMETTSYWVRVSDTCGYADSDTATITVIPLSVSAHAVPQSGYCPLTVAFSASTTDGTPPYSYHWDFGDGAVGSGESVSHTYAAPGSYAASLTATDALGGTGTASVEITAAVKPPAISRVTALSSPFRLKVKGETFHAGCVIKVNGTAVPITLVQSGTLLMAKGGDALKAMLPKGQTVQITVTNADDGGVSAPCSFTR